MARRAKAPGSNPKSKGGRRKPSYRPNPVRMLMFAVITLASVMAGYGLGLVLVGGSSKEEMLIPARTAETTPWYRTQSPPPGMVTAPSLPIFPDPIEGAPAETARPYEEALPAEVHVRLAVPHPPRAAPIPEPSAKPAPPPISRKTTPPVSPDPDGLAWKRFAVAAPPDRGLAKVVVVIDDLGIDKKRSAAIAALPHPLTLSYLSYATGLRRQTEAARGRGHELLVHVPMEPQGHGVDPGPKVLTVGLAPADLLDRLRWGLSRFDAFIGINNHMGSKFTGDINGMEVVLKELKARGLMFLDSRTTNVSVGHALAQHMGVAFAERNIFLDNENNPDAVNARLKELEGLARRRGYAIAIGHPRSATIEALGAWLPTLEARGFQLVPLSAVVRVPTEAG